MRVQLTMLFVSLLAATPAVAQSHRSAGTLPQGRSSGRHRHHHAHRRTPFAPVEPVAPEPTPLEPAPIEPRPVESASPSARARAPQPEATSPVEPVETTAPSPAAPDRPSAPVVRGAAVRSRGVLYVDGDHTTVATTAVEAEGRMAGVTLRGGYLVDLVSSASVDVVAAATHRFTERRQELRGGADAKIGDAILSASYVRSTENDWWSHAVTGGGSLDLAQHATTLALGAGVIFNDVGRAGDASFAARQQSVSGTLRWTQAIDPENLVSIGYAGQAIDGYQSSPYRFVTTLDGAVVPEAHPDRRLRHSVTLRWRRSLARTLALGLDERLYADDWGVRGTTTVMQLTWTLGRGWDLELHDRLHLQTGASFYADSYATVQGQRYLSADRELSTFWDDYAGLALVFARVQLGPFAELRLEASAQAFYYRFLDFHRLPERLGGLFMLAAEGKL